LSVHCLTLTPTRRTYGYLILDTITTSVIPMARPAKDPTVGSRTEAVRVRLAPQEVEWIALAAEEQGLTLAEFMRGTAVSASASYIPHAQGAATP
jgi:hypothetical protein